MAGAVFVDLTAADVTVRHLGLTCKLLRLLPDRHMVHMIMEMVGNRSFNLTTGNGKRRRLRRLKNGVPQGSVLAFPLFKIYISDLPNTISRKYAYADDLAIMHADEDWQAVEGVLRKGMATLGEYLQTWKQKLSTTKTVSAAFHLNNKEAKRELKVNFNNETLTFFRTKWPHNSSVYLTTTYVRPTGRTTNGMRSDWTAPQDSALSSPTPAPIHPEQGRNQLFGGGAVFTKFHSMTSSCLFNRGTTFSQTVTDNVLFTTLTKMRTFQF